MSRRNAIGESTTSGDTELEDPGEANRRHQVEELNKVRADITEINTRGEQQLGRDRQHQALFNTVTEYARLLAPYLRDPDLQAADAKPVWEQRIQYAVDPPVPDTEPTGELTRRVVTLDGLDEFLQLSDHPTESFEYEVNPPGERQKTRTAAVDARPPRRILRRMVLELDDFRRRVGLGLQLEDTGTTLNLE